MLIKSRIHLPGVVTRAYQSLASRWFPEFSSEQGLHMNVLAQLQTPAGVQLIPAHNIITDAGDLWYAQKAMGETPTNDFAGGKGVMCSAGTPGKTANYSSFTPIASAALAVDATYPKRNDGDANNTGAGVDIVTWRFSYSAASFANAAITHGLITLTTATGTDPLLTGFAFAASFAKTTSDPLTVWVNHEFLGV